MPWVVLAVLGELLEVLLGVLRRVEPEKQQPVLPGARQGLLAL
jgi:hypothetical protein